LAYHRLGFLVVNLLDQRVVAVELRLAQELEYRHPVRRRQVEVELFALLRLAAASWVFRAFRDGRRVVLLTQEPQQMNIPRILSADKEVQR
jgi:hypothetical protein